MGGSPRREGLLYNDPCFDQGGGGRAPDGDRFRVSRILLDYVHHEPETAGPSGELMKERYTRQEAEALADEIQSLSHFFE